MYIIRIVRKHIYIITFNSWYIFVNKVKIVCANDESAAKMTQTSRTVDFLVDRAPDKRMAVV